MADKKTQGNWCFGIPIQLEVQPGSASILRGPWRSRPRLMAHLLGLYLLLGPPATLMRNVETICISCFSCLLSSLMKNRRMVSHPAHEENLSAGICYKLENTIYLLVDAFLGFELLPASKLPNISSLRMPCPINLSLPNIYPLPYLFRGVS